jgi:hypothetical protein
LDWRGEIGKYFCSQLVAEAYSSQGFSLLDRPPEKTTPGMLADAKTLVNLDHRTVLEFKPSGTLGFEPAFLDGHNETSPAERESMLKQSVCSKMAPVFAELGIVVSTYHGALQALIEGWKRSDPSTKALDTQFAKTVLTSGLLGLPELSFPAHCDSFFLDFYIANAISHGRLSQDDLRRLLVFYDQELARTTGCSVSLGAGQVSNQPRFKHSSASHRAPRFDGYIKKGPTPPIVPWRVDVQDREIA